MLIILHCNRFLDFIEWEELLSESGLYHRYFTVREARLSFLWSRMRCLDDHSTAKAYQRSRSLTFLEFIEALGRVADLVSPPPPEEMVASGCVSGTPSAEYYRRGLDQAMYLGDRPSAAIGAPKTRMLDEKIDQVRVEYLLLDDSGVYSPMGRVLLGFLLSFAAGAWLLCCRF